MKITRINNTVKIDLGEGHTKEMNFYTGLQAQIAFERATEAAEAYYNQVTN